MHRSWIVKTTTLTREAFLQVNNAPPWTQNVTYDIGNATRYTSQDLAQTASVAFAARFGVTAILEEVLS